MRPRKATILDPPAAVGKGNGKAIAPRRARDGVCDATRCPPHLEPGARGRPLCRREA